MSDLIALAERCEQATGPDADLDEDIFKAVDPEGHRGAALRRYHSGHREPINQPAYTASLDAAMTLVPETDDGGFRLTFDKPLARKCWAEVWMHENAEPGDGFYRATAATIPLALCAAALRAQASQGTGGLDG